MKFEPPSSKQCSGYSLIEILVVLAIISIVALVSLPGLGPKSPKAVRAGLQDLKASLQQARGLAISNGKPINISISFNSDNTVRFETYDLDDTGNSKTVALMDVTIGGNWMRYARVTTQDPPLSTEVSPIKELESLKTLGFSGWSNPISAPSATASTWLGFSAQGFPQSVDSTTFARTPWVGGTWLGVYGLTTNKTGIPYGAVFLTETGIITAYFKPDSLSEIASDKWQRLE